MSGEQQAAVEQQTQNQAADEAEEAFSAGYGKPEAQATGEQQTAEGATTEQQGTEKAAAAPEKAPEPVLINGIPEAEWNAAVAKAAGPLVAQAQAQAQAEIRKNFGQIGEIKKTLQTLQASIAAGGSTASRKKLTAEALKRVNEELPGLGDALAQDLAEYLDSPAVAADAATAKAAAEARGQAFDAEAFFNTKIGPALTSLEARANERAELRIVKSIHRDFDTVVQSKEFGEWLGTLPAEQAAHIRDSEDGFVAADAVTDFKAAQKAKAQTRVQNKNRLERAIPARGEGGAQGHANQDDVAAFAAGVESVK